MHLKSSLARLLHAFIPFSIMVLIQRVLLLLFGYIRMPSNTAALFAFVPAALCCAVAFFLIKVTPSGDEEDEEIPPLTKKSVACSFLQTAVAVAVMAVLMYVVSAIMDEQLADTVSFSVLSAVSLIVIHPIIEEYVFRGLIYTEMRRMSPVFAILAQAVMFAIVHNTVNEMLYALVAGVVLAGLVEVSGRLSTSIAAHMIINARSFIYMTYLADRPQIIRILDTMLFVLGAISLIGVIVMRGFSDGTVESDEVGEVLEVEDDEE